MTKIKSITAYNQEFISKEVVIELLEKQLEHWRTVRKIRLNQFEINENLRCEADIVAVIKELS